MDIKKTKNGRKVYLINEHSNFHEIILLKSKRRY